MANEYLYGAYGHIGETVAQSAVQAGTTPVYIGTAPVNLVRDFGKAGIINAPIKITSLVDAQKKIGYSSDWGTFTLCEAVYRKQHHRALQSIPQNPLRKARQPDRHALPHGGHRAHRRPL